MRDRAIEQLFNDLPLAGEDLYVEPESHLPIQDRVVDKLADMMYASDMLLDILNDDRYYVPEHLRLVEPSVRKLYNEVNHLMKQLTD